MSGLKLITPSAADEARHALENAIVKIGGVANTLFSLGQLRDDGDHLVGTVAYLSNVLRDHYDAAYAAFGEIYGLDKG